MAEAGSRLIAEYRVTYFAGGRRTAQPYPFRAVVTLHDAEGLIAGLYFHSDPATLPDGDRLGDGGQAMAHFPAEDLPRVLDLLRNEKPVSFQRLASFPAMAALHTGTEPIGEGERD